ncbi:MAG: hypothetical protein HC932_01655 [Thermales bacterium]|nr:hypothetical protein [Thermales bacterium]
MPKIVDRYSLDIFIKKSQNNNIEPMKIFVSGDFYLAFEINYDSIVNNHYSMIKNLGLVEFLKDRQVFVPNEYRNSRMLYYSLSTKCCVSVITNIMVIFKFRFICSKLWINKIHQINYYAKLDKNNQVIDWNNLAQRLDFRNGEVVLINRANRIDQLNGFFHSFLTTEKYTSYQKIIVRLLECLILGYFLGI